MGLNKNNTEIIKKRSLNMFTIRKHADGRLTINLPLALLMAFITILGLIVTPAISLGSMQEKVNHLEAQTIDINNRLYDVEEATISMKSSVSNIEKNIDVIRLDIREIREQVTE